MACHYDKRNKQRKAIRTILNVLLKDKRYGFEKLATTQQIAERRQKLKKMVNFLSSHRKSQLVWGVWKLRKNLLDSRRSQVQHDIKLFETKIINSNDPDISAIREKK